MGSLCLVCKNISLNYPAWRECVILKMGHITSRLSGLYPKVWSGSGISWYLILPSKPLEDTNSTSMAVTCEWLSVTSFGAAVIVRGRCMVVL
jgi:hypothetical protein